MGREYFPILMLVGFVAANAVMMLALSHLTIRPRPTPVKQIAYESGIPPLGDARERFSVKFYMVAMLFIVFDIETIFLYPWAVASKNLGILGLVEIVLFIATVFIAYAYIWRRGGLDWD
jgi:NADH-quinone oxidoreductase subunit A